MGGRRGALRWAAGAMFGALLPLAAAAGGGPLSPSELAGKRLYHEGVAASGATVLAQVGPQGAPVPATILPCVNCHGADGLGRPEGGIRPPAITWAELSKPYGHHHDPAGGGSGRVHPAFDAASFARAVQSGVDPAGNRLDPAMPRYTMAASDVRDLVAYLKRIADDLDPGLLAGRVRVALLTQGDGGAGSLAAARAVVHAAVARGNAAGGVHGRQVDLVEFDAGAGADALRAVLQAAAREDVFAVLMPQEAPAGLDWQSLSGLPLIGGFAPPDAANAAGTQAFFALPGLGDELVALAAAADSAPATAGQYVAGAGGTGTLAALHWPGDTAAAAALDRLDAYLASRPAGAAPGAHAAGRRPVERHVVGDADALETALRALRSRGTAQLVVMLPAEPLAALMRAGEAYGEAPTAAVLPSLLVPLRFAAPLLGGLPEAWAGRVNVSMVASPGEVGAGARAIFAAAREQPVHGKAPAGNAHPLTQVAALASVELLVEGLKRAGRKASRKGFADALAAMSEVPTEAGPHISFGPTRRVGAVGVHVLQLGRGGRVASARLVRLDRE